VKWDDTTTIKITALLPPPLPPIPRSNDAQLALHLQYQTQRFLYGFTSLLGGGEEEEEAGEGRMMMVVSPDLLQVSVQEQGVIIACLMELVPSAPTSNDDGE